MNNNLFDLTGKNALITGSSQGIGFSLARGLASAGATVIINGRDETKIATAVQKLSDEGFNVEQSAFDVTDVEAVKMAVDKIEADIGAIDILVNNAGMQIRCALEDFTSDNWRKLMSTNVDSVFYVSQAVARHMIARKAGKIINVSSVQARLGRKSISPYAASKGAVAMFTKAMCVEWAEHNIQVNSLAPGYFKTELTSALVEDPEFTSWLEARTPANRWGNVEELSGACVFLASPSASFVNGHILYVDGGLTVSV